MRAERPNRLRYTAAMSAHADFLLEPDWLLPIAPAAVVHEGFGLAIAGTDIAAVAPRERLREQFPDAPRIDLAGRILMPGLVNAHGHMAMTLLRGLAEDLPLDAWLKERVWPIEARNISESFVTDGTAHAVLEMLKSGTTTAADMYFFPERSAAVIRRAGMRAQVAFPLISHPNAWSASAAEAFHKGLALRDEYRDDALIRIAFGPHSTYALTAADLEKTLTLAQELDAPIHIHLHETEQEVLDARAATGQTPFALLDALGGLIPNVQAVHVTSLDDADLDRLASRAVAVVHCPHSNLKLGSGYCPVGRLIASGIRVGLGTDGAASNNSLDLFAELRTAALLAKAIGRDPRALPAFEALALATIGGARVLGLDEQIGTLEVGKRADLIAIDLARPAATPSHRPEVSLVHGSAGAWVTHVWIDGRPIVADGRALTLDEREVVARADFWRRRLHAERQVA